MSSAIEVELLRAGELDLQAQEIEGRVHPGGDLGGCRTPLAMQEGRVKLKNQIGARLGGVQDAGGNPAAA